MSGIIIYLHLWHIYLHLWEKVLVTKGVFSVWGIPLDRKYPYLVGGFNPSEKYARQIGSSPQGSGWKKKYVSCHHPDINLAYKGEDSSI